MKKILIGLLALASASTMAAAGLKCIDSETGESVIVKRSFLATDLAARVEQVDDIFDRGVHEALDGYSETEFKIYGQTLLLNSDMKILNKYSKHSVEKVLTDDGYRSFIKIGDNYSYVKAIQLSENTYFANILYREQVSFLKSVFIHINGACTVIDL